MKVFILLLCSFLLWGCQEEEKPDPRKKYTYHVFIRNGKDNRTFYAGSTVGLASCGIIARRAFKQRSNNELKGQDWQTICCWYSGKTQCLEEHSPEDRNIDYEEWQGNQQYHKKPERSYLLK